MPVWTWTLLEQNLGTIASSGTKKFREMLKEKGVTYEKEGAIWFKASDFGDDQDTFYIFQKSHYPPFPFYLHICNIQLNNQKC